MATICSGHNCGGTCEATTESNPYTCTSSNCYNNCNFGCTTAICASSGSSCTATNCHNSCNEGSCIDLCYKICSSWVQNKPGASGCGSSSCSATSR